MHFYFNKMAILDNLTFTKYDQNFIIYITQNFLYIIKLSPKVFYAIITRYLPITSLSQDKQKPKTTSFSKIVWLKPLADVWFALKKVITEIISLVLSFCCPMISCVAQSPQGKMIV